MTDKTSKSSTIGGGAAKVLGWVVAGLLVLWFVWWLFGWGAYSPERQRQVEQPKPNPTLQQNSREPRRNLVREQWLRDCATQNAPVTELGGGVMNCHRDPTVITIID